MTRRADPVVAGDGGAASPAPPGFSSARLVAAGIFLSRIAGFIRDIIFAGYLGTSMYASAFRAALRMPNVLQNLLGEGTLSASFIPVYSKLLERGETEKAGRLAGSMFALLLAVAGALSLFGMLLAPVLVRVFLAGFSGELREITIACTRIIFPMTGVLVLSAWALGVLNSHRRFFVSYTAPVLWNASIIAVLVLFGNRLDGRSLVIALSWGALVGGILQFLVQLPWILRSQRELRVNWNVTSDEMRIIRRTTAPAILGRGVVQLSGWVDMFLASFLFAGAVAALNYAQTLYMLPVSLFGMSIAAAELPELSRVGGDDAETLQRRVSAGLRQMAVFVVPSVVGYLVLGDIIVGGLYERNAFDHSDTMLVSLILAAYSIGLFASTASRLYVSAMFAQHDTKTPARIAAVRVLASALIGGSLMIYLEPVNLPDYAWLGNLAGTPIGGGGARFIAGQPVGAAGLAAGTGIAAWLEWMLVRRAVHARIGNTSSRRVVLLLLLAAVVGAVAARGVVLLLPPMPRLPTLVVALGVLGGLYFGLASVLGVTEVRTAIERVRRVGRTRKG